MSKLVEDKATALDLRGSVVLLQGILARDYPTSLGFRLPSASPVQAVEILLLSVKTLNLATFPQVAGPGLARDSPPRNRIARNETMLPM